MKILCDRCKREYEYDSVDAFFHSDSPDKLKELLCPNCKEDNNLDN